MNKKTALMALALPCLLAFAGCGQQPPSPSAAPSPGSTLTAAEAEAIAREAYIFGAAFNSNYRVFIDRILYRP